jgi:hypothetical protein|tara:strand:+ start:465 stop:656 length:192 start_codon:yes stop_codon:yes gene_type:complete
MHPRYPFPTSGDPGRVFVGRLGRVEFQVAIGIANVNSTSKSQIPRIKNNTWLVLVIMERLIVV